MNKRAIAFLQKMEELKVAKANKQKQLTQEKSNMPDVGNISKPSIKLIPIEQLPSQYNYTCPRCNGFIVYDTLFINDLTGKYIPLDRETMRVHHCNKKSNGVLDVKVD